MYIRRNNGPSKEAMEPLFRLWPMKTIVHLQQLFAFIDIIRLSQYLVNCLVDRYEMKMKETFIQNPAEDD